MKVQNFDKKNVAQFRNELSALLAKFGEDSIDFKIGTMRFTSGSVRMTVEAVVKGAKTPASRDLEFWASREGLTLDEVIIRGQRAKLVEYHSRKPKYPYIYEMIATGKRFKCDPYSAKVYFGKK